VHINILEEYNGSIFRVKVKNGGAYSQETVAPVHKSTIQWPKLDDQTKKKKKLQQIDI